VYEPFILPYIEKSERLIEIVSICSENVIWTLAFSAIPVSPSEGFVPVT